ncbi:MAG TPA: transposase [Prosthecobacter sp.]
MFKPFDWNGSVGKHERYLPHWEQEGCSYFITWRLADSVDQDTLKAWKQERDVFFTAHPRPWDEAIEDAYHKQFTRRMERWLDAGRGSCVLRDWRCREVVAEAFRHFEGVRYDLAAWVVMPNHVHAIVCPHAGRQLSQLLHSWKSFTAKKINESLGQRGTLWMDESFDHIIRDKASLERFVRYVRNNPVKAGLGSDEYELWVAEGMG